MDQQLLDRFFKGKCSAEEQQKVLSWYLSGEADQELGAKIDAFWSAQQDVPQSEWGKEDVLANIQKEINAQTPISPIQAVGSANVRRWFYAAAVISILIVASLSYLLINASQAQDELADSEHVPPSNVEIIKQTAPGEKLTLILDDSTVIRLNSGSQLRYRVDSYREVILEGEAFFDVTRDTLNPFLIQTGDITTTVLGTSFNIRAFAEDEKIAVSVVSGQVQVAKQQDVSVKALRLEPGEQAMYDLKETRMVKGKFNYENVLSWKEGRLHFKNAQFSDIVQTLERWYGVNIEVRREYIENGFSGSYTNRSLESVLEGMSFVLDFEFDIQDKKVIIR